MTDKQKVIKGIESCIADPEGTTACGLCPYQQIQINGGRCQNRLFFDILNIFEEEEHKYEDDRK